ncbi:CYTH domain-containing protein [Desulfonema limicola]|uniref:CYTH domain-containing protein n=1 Tax=Desulfonema limicola TaxID=45656 RepID=A0A975B7J2_9BACT|nr:CYTH domain-containing protein [Desulfonema limicola]QTA80256.1 CYTH domain-containing protein [Desulfonema limicola]
MLVLQRNADHVLNDGCKRAGVDPKWLLEVIAEINLFVPDDWRLTRTTNNFRIRIVSHPCATFVGSCYRTHGDNILHIIDSLHLPGFHDCKDLRKRQHEFNKKITSNVKKENPEILVPNLYYFRPYPEGFSSPLFARQYERIKQKKDGTKAGDQYHRIHPITKAGLDLEHFMWIRWSITGTVEIVESPDPLYHGKDYWKVPLLENARSRVNLETYEKTFERLLKKYHISLPVLPEKQAAPYEIEYKLTVPEKESDTSAVFNLILETLENNNNKTGFYIGDQEKRHKTQIDIYFDDNRFSLYETGASFRMRKKDNIRVTLKKRFDCKQRDTENGLYRRIEEEAVITASQQADLMAGKPVNSFPYRLLPYIVPDCGLLSPRVIVKNERRIIYIQDHKYRKAELCFDRVIYQIEGKNYGPFFEIEIESKGADSKDIEQLAGYLEKNLELTKSKHSKYERGVLIYKNSINGGKKNA